VVQTETKEEHEDPPGQKPPHPWEDLPWERWNDWRWQLSHRLNTAEDFALLIRLTPEEVTSLSAFGRFRVDVTPYFATLMDPDEPTCPIQRQVIPTASELLPFETEMADSLAEDARSPVPGLVHRYPDRALMLVTTQCASYCRYCTRSRMVGDPHAQFSSSDYGRQVAYIAATSQIRDVLLSGGDPLILPQRVLERLLTRLRAIPHVEIIRIGTRLGIPYTGPKVLAHALSLDKAAAKHIWHDLGLSTAPFQVFYRGDDPLDRQLTFPLFVKLVRQGTGMGINSLSIVHNQAELREQEVRWVIQAYGQPTLEINTLPGLNPTVSDLCIMARAGGMHYTDLINENLYLAADRYAKECRDMERQASGGNGRVRAFQEAVPVRG